MEKTYNRWNKKEVCDSQMALTYFINRYALDMKDQRLLKLMMTRPFEELLKEYQFKKIKGKAIYCLQKWVQGEWDLILGEKIFTPFEILSFQARGIRPVTMKFLDTNSPVMHRDSALDFFVHDLEHGYMYFYDSDMKNSQQKFFERIEKSLKTDLWEEYLLDKDFRAKFYYLISDMNSHLEHYRAYLNSMIPPSNFSKFNFLFMS